MEEFIIGTVIHKGNGQDITTLNAESNEDDKYNSCEQHTCIIVLLPSSVQT